MAPDSTCKTADQPVGPARTNSLLDEGADLLAITARAAAYSGIQEPLSGVTQLAGAKAPDLIDNTPAYKFNTAEWYASTIGHGIGAAVPYLLTAKLTGGIFKSDLAGKALLDGAASGFVFTPTDGTGNAFEQRSMAAISSAAMFGTQNFVAGKLLGALGPLEGLALPAAARLAANSASGAAGSIAGLELTSALTTHHLNTDGEQLLENAVAGASTGFALDATHQALGGINSAAGALRSRFGEVKSNSDPERKADKLTFQKQRQPAASTEAAEVPGLKDLKDWSNDALTAHKYQTAMAQEYWQTNDGRIFYSEGAGTDEKLHVWTPYGVLQPKNAYIDSTPGDLGRPIYTRFEPLGVYEKDGQPDFDSRRNDYRGIFENKDIEPISAELRDKLTVPLPRRLEPDFAAAQRVLPRYGSDFLPYEGTFESQKPGKVPANISFKDFNKQFVEWTKQPARNYYILGVEGADALSRIGKPTLEQSDELAKDSTNVILPEAYGKELDKIRELRKTATLDPEHFPEQREEILRARRDIFDSRYRDRYLPEHWGQFLDVLPNKQRIQNLRLYDWDAPDQNGTGIVADADITSGRVSFWNAHAGAEQHVRQTLLHEYSHMLETAYPELFEAFRRAFKADGQFAARDYANKNDSENLAVHMGEMMLDPDPEHFLTLANNAPIKTVILNEMLRSELALADSGENPHTTALYERVKYVDEHVLPEAKSKIAELLENATNPYEIQSVLSMMEAMNQTQKTMDLKDKLVDPASIVNGLKKYEATPERKYQSADALSVLIEHAYLHRLEGDNAADAAISPEALKNAKGTASSAIHGFLNDSKIHVVAMGLRDAQSLADSGVFGTKPGQFADGADNRTLIDLSDLQKVTKRANKTNAKQAQSLLDQLRAKPAAVQSF